MQSWELVFRRPGESDRAESIKADNLAVGDAIPHDGMAWVVTADDGPSALPDHAARLICESKRG